MRKGNLYKCVSVTGSDKEIDEGIWRIKTKTPKTLIVEKITEKEIWDNYEKGNKIICHLGETRGLTTGFINVLRDWGDETFTIYPNQSGTPYCFEPYDK